MSRQLSRLGKNSACSIFYVWPGNCSPIFTNFGNITKITAGSEGPGALKIFKVVKHDLLGQELTARTHHVGETRKRVVPVTLEREIQIEGSTKLLAGLLGWSRGLKGFGAAALLAGLFLAVSFLWILSSVLVSFFITFQVSVARVSYSHSTVLKAWLLSASLT